ERAQALSRSIEQNLPGILRVDQPTAGMHALGWLPSGMNDRTVSSRAAAAGVSAWPLSSCYWHSDAGERPGLVLGFAAYSPEAISEGVCALAKVVKSM